jgi:hypothetical protein
VEVIAYVGLLYKLLDPLCCSVHSPLKVVSIEPSPSGGINSKVKSQAELDIYKEYLPVSPGSYLSCYCVQNIPKKDTWKLQQCKL